MRLYERVYVCVCVCVCVCGGGYFRGDIFSCCEKCLCCDRFVRDVFVVTGVSIVTERSTCVVTGVFVLTYLLAL